MELKVVKKPPMLLWWKKGGDGMDEARKGTL